MSYGLPGYEDLELSTQILIREALRRGHRVEVLDRVENIIRLEGNGRMEYVKQATRTSRDSYIVPLLMENKAVTKRILGEAGIRVPKGIFGTDREGARAVYADWKDRGCVVKPNTTNFGTAVSVLEAPVGEDEFEEAWKRAFDADGTVLVEERLRGKEYRFLVIHGDVVAVLHRMPANVTGDGSSTIRELVEKKNADPRRGTGYVLPLEKLKLGETELEFLAARGFSPASVPGKGEAVFLRENSNISTGGDSIDFTDIAHPGYAELASAAARAVRAEICGVDLMAEDIRRKPEPDTYGIIELNFNPALHIHAYPYEGKNRGAEKAVLDLIGM